MPPGILEDVIPEIPEVIEDVPVSTTTPPDGSLPVDAPVRPEYIPENFWNAEKGEVNTEGMAKSYAELRKAFNERNNDRPAEDVEDYMSKDFFDDNGNFKSDIMPVHKDDPGLQAAYAAAKEAELGVKQANAFISNFMNGMKDFIPTPVDVEAEIKSLGENAAAKVSGLKTWVDGMKNNGELNDDTYSAILDLGKTASGIKALEVLRGKSGELAPPIGEALSGSMHMSLSDWYSATYETHGESGESRIAYNARMSELGKKLIGTGHGTFDGGGYWVNK